MRPMFSFLSKKKKKTKANKHTSHHWHWDGPGEVVAWVVLVGSGSLLLGTIEHDISNSIRAPAV